MYLSLASTATGDDAEVGCGLQWHLKTSGTGYTIFNTGIGEYACSYDLVCRAVYLSQVQTRVETNHNSHRLNTPRFF
jgi:hypothetical protein